MKEFSQLEKKLNDVKSFISPDKDVFNNFLNKAVTLSRKDRLVNKLPWFYKIAPIFATFLILAATVFSYKTNQTMLSLDITDLEYREIEDSFEIETAEWAVFEELDLLAIELEEDIL